MCWHILDTGSASAARNMEIDYALLRELSSRAQPTLHLYDWEEPSATYGYFLDPASLVHNEALAKYHLTLARRPTGGGLLFHLTDFAFSLLIPAKHPSYTVNTLQNYAFVNGWLAKVIEAFTHKKTELFTCAPSCGKVEFCMANPTQYDVMISGKKVAGGAQRRTKHGFLHQGSVSLTSLPEQFLTDVLKSHSLASKIKEISFSQTVAASQDLKDMRFAFKKSLIQEVLSQQLLIKLR